MRSRYLALIVPILLAAGCGTDSQSVKLLAGQPATRATTDLHAAPPSITEAATPASAPSELTDPPVPASAPTESTIHRAVVVVGGSTAAIELPADEEGRTSTMRLRVVEIEGGSTPYLEVDASDALAVRNAMSWVVRINGRRVNKFGAIPGSSFGMRLTREEAAGGVLVSIWSENRAGQMLHEPIDVQLEEYRGD